MQAWYVYMVRCADGTLYTGIATDVERRLAEHNGVVKGRGAKYTHGRRPVALVYQQRCADKRQAASEEWALKKLSRQQKLLLIDKA